MPQMKALKAFRMSETGQSIRVGMEFSCSQGVARSYEKRGLAAQVHAPAQASAQPAQNRAAETGPLASAGGPIGAVPPPSSSEAGQAQPTLTLEPSAGAPDASASTTDSDSPDGPTSSTPATQHGGGRNRSRSGSQA